MIDYSSRAGLFFMDCMIEFLEKIQKENKGINETINGLKLGKEIMKDGINKKENDKKTK